MKELLKNRRPWDTSGLIWFGLSKLLGVTGFWLLLWKCLALLWLCRCRWAFRRVTSSVLQDVLLSGRLLNNTTIQMELSTKQGCIWTLLMYRVLQTQPGHVWSGADLKATSHLVAGVENFEIQKDSEASAWVSYCLSHLQPYWNLARKLVIRTPEDLLSWQYPGVFSFKGVSVAVSYCWQSPEFSQGTLDTDWPFHPPSHLEHCEGWRGLRAQPACSELILHLFQTDGYLWVPCQLGVHETLPQIKNT